MIKARHHRVVYPLFRWLTRVMMSRYFRYKPQNTEWTDNGNGILILANHVSWWDGFWLEYHNLKWLHRKLHFMMLEEQLLKHWYFQLTGGYSVKKGSREVLESISYTIELLSDKCNMVIIFPQGKITSSYIPFVTFEKGVQVVVDRISENTQVLFVANIVDYFSEFRPGLYVYSSMFTAADLKNGNAERLYNEFYTEALANHNKRKE